MFDQTKLVDPKRAQQHFEEKMRFTTGPAELNSLITKGATINIIDVRAEKDYQEGHIPTAINLPKDQWNTFRGLVKDRNNVIYCYSAVCHLGAAAALEFAAKGFPVMELDGGMKSWREYNYQIEIGPGGQMAG